MYKNKRGQLGIGDAPGVVLIVLFLFMCMGTAAFVLEEYGESMGADESGSVDNETLTTVTEIGETVAAASACNFENFAVVEITNKTGSYTVITSANYTINADTGIVYYAGSAGWPNNTDWNITYTYNYGGLECNVTVDLTEEISDNTSIAGMILTIALIGIVLSILIGLFYVFTGKRGGM